jgi:hypothetical protein
MLDRYRELEGLLRGLIQNREVLLMQRGDRFYVKGLNIAHNRFTGLCRSLGLTAKDYPLNQDENSRRSLRNECAGIARRASLNPLPALKHSAAIRSSRYATVGAPPT